MELMSYKRTDGKIPGGHTHTHTHGSSLPVWELQRELRAFSRSDVKQLTKNNNNDNWITNLFWQKNNIYKYNLNTLLKK